MKTKNTHFRRMRRRPEVWDQFGYGNTTLHRRIHDGLFPPPIKTSARSVAWPSDELDQVMDFLIAGKSDDEIRALVAHLVEQRKEMAA